MLYIWPCIVFFSWPVLLPGIVKLPRKKLPPLSAALAMMELMLLAVHFNTIVHPLTLADNQHYIFYVFRILLRHRCSSTLLSRRILRALGW
jgi:alpha-1,2-glucosyltransferase